MKTETKIMTTQLSNQIVEIQKQIILAKNVLLEIDELLENLTDRTFNIMNSIEEIKK
jgi:hypothetical protein